MFIDEKVKILIVESDPAFTQILFLFLRDIGLQQVWIAANYEEAIRLYDEVTPDLLLVDSDLGTGHKSGINTVQKIRETAQNIPVIYFTSHYNESCYNQCRTTKPYAFLNKEISLFKLKQTIDLALLSSSNIVQIPETVQSFSSVAPVPSQLFFKIGDTLKAIPLDTIAYFYADHRLSYAKVGQRSFPTSIKLKSLEKMLHPNFIRIHKAHLINVRMIESIDPKENTLCLNGDILPIGEIYKKSFFEQLYVMK